MANEIIRGMGTSHTAVAAVDFEKSLKFYAALGIKCFTQWGGRATALPFWMWATAHALSCLKSRG
ncbi:MAG: hypothetical protein L6V84_03750 [Oscillospiraceae bacterium]|nr:MAG: hypothetical protein L6V84_03750 [Oscillospiraceae bacterium]